MPQTPAPRQTPYERVAKSVCDLLDTGLVPWRKPWDARVGPPMNGVSKKRYRGFNVFALHLAGHACPWWFTPKQVGELGGHVRKGEKVTWITFWKKWTPKDAQDEADALELTFGDPVKPRQVLVVRFYRVVNLLQCDGDGVERFKEAHRDDLPAHHPHDPIAACQAVIDGMPNPPVIEFGGDRAFYRFRQDIVRIPAMAHFDSPEAFYQTCYHELTHSTGHEKRLARRSLGDTVPFGTPEYSREELVAEMGAAFLCAHAGIEQPILENSASYLQHWKSFLQDDPRALLVAAAQAQKAADYILGDNAWQASQAA